jgi:hypothetical protein
MRLKDGFQVCDRCGGGGCYWCQRQGWRAQCPRCANTEPSLLVKKDEGIVCLACESTFEKDGNLSVETEDARLA